MAQRCSCSGTCIYEGAKEEHGGGATSARQMPGREDVENRVEVRLGEALGETGCLEIEVKVHF